MEIHLTIGFTGILLNFDRINAYLSKAGQAMHVTYKENTAGIVSVPTTQYRKTHGKTLELFGCSRISLC